MQTLLQLIEALCADSKAVAIKKETEAEGTSLEDILIFRALTWRMQLPFYVKIGGCEAVTDIHVCKRAHVDGIIAPMIESSFALQKFLNAVDKVYGASPRPRCIINIETKAAVKELDAILETCADAVDDITIGRTDLSSSYNDPKVTPDSEFLMQVIDEIAGRITSQKFKMNMGGNINVNTPALLKKYPALQSNLQYIETRNVLFDARVGARDIETALRFEQHWLDYQQHVLKEQLQENSQRLEKIAKRLL